MSAESGTFLQLLDSDAREDLLSLGGAGRFASGTRLMQQGEPGDTVMVLREGHIQASFVDADGREVVLSFRGPGDVLGELSFTRREPRSASVTAIESVVAHTLASAQFRAFLERRPTAAIALIEIIGERFRDANHKRIQFAAQDTIGRVATRLVELCERYGDRTVDGIAIRLPITQADLGSWTASSRAGVTSALKTMRDLGWIRTERRRLTVLDLDAVMRRSAHGEVDRSSSLS